MHNPEGPSLSNGLWRQRQQGVDMLPAIQALEERKAENEADIAAIRNDAERRIQPLYEANVALGLAIQRIEGP